MSPLQEKIKSKPIKEKLAIIFRRMHVAYLIIALIALGGMIISKNIVGAIVVVVVGLVGFFYNYRTMCSLEELLVFPLKEMAAASEQIAEGNVGNSQNGYCGYVEHMQQRILTTNCIRGPKNIEHNNRPIQ